MPIKIKNWSSYQSYKDRNPPWIRFNKKFLDDYDYHSMSSDARALLPMLWLLASEDDDPTSGLIQSDFKKIAFRLRMDKKILSSSLREISDHDFIELIQPCDESVTNPYPIRNESVTSENRDRDRDRDREQRQKEVSIRGSRFTLSSLPPEWKDYCIQKRSDLDAEETFSAFRDYWIAQPASKGVKVDWFATWRTWLRRADNQKTRGEHGRSNGKISGKSEQARIAADRGLREMEEYYFPGSGGTGKC